MPRFRYRWWTLFTGELGMGIRGYLDIHVGSTRSVAIWNSVKRTMQQAVALIVFSNRGNTIIQNPYSKPAAIKAQIAIFFGRDICTFHNTAIGRPEQMRSVITRKTWVRRQYHLTQLDRSTDFLGNNQRPSKPACSNMKPSLSDPKDLSPVCTAQEAWSHRKHWPR